MSRFPITIKPFGENAVLMEWPQHVDEAILKDILGFQEYIAPLLGTGWVSVPSYSSLTLIREGGPVDFPQLSGQLLDWYNGDREAWKVERHLWKLPVCYDLDFGLDLEETAKRMNRSTEELIALHTAHTYTVFGIGFLPGFMYLGGLPKTLETRRRETPRLQVEKGSVGLAGKQTGIYPQQSPGGWNIIGRCPVPLFNLHLETPCFVAVGDKIRFVPIDRATYDLKRIEAEVGIYQPEKLPLDA